MIPVIGTAIINSTFYVHKLLMSIDYPVENFIVINNSGNPEYEEQLGILKSIKHDFVKKVHIVNLPSNIGCGGAWNLIIKSFINAEYWILVNDDITFNTGLLEEIATIAADKSIGMIHPYEGDFSLGSFDCFMIRDSVVQTYGLFDENCYPAYCEDADYIMRMAHKPVKKYLKTKHSFLHGGFPPDQYYTKGSLSKRRDQDLWNKLEVINFLNMKYLDNKWGEDWHNTNPAKTPWSDNHSIRDTGYDLQFNRSKYLGF